MKEINKKEVLTWLSVIENKILYEDYEGAVREIALIRKAMNGDD